MDEEAEIVDDAEIDVAQERHRAVLARVPQRERTRLREADRCERRHGACDLLLAGEAFGLGAFDLRRRDRRVAVTLRG